MHLIGVDDNGKLEEIYFQDVNKEDVDILLEGARNLREMEAFYKAKPRPQTFQFSETQLEVLMQRQLLLFHADLERREKTKKSYWNYLNIRRKTKVAQFKIWILGLLKKVFGRTTVKTKKQ